MVSLALWTTGCGAAATPPARVPIVDLLTEFPHAEARPAGSYRIALQQAAGATRAAIVGPAPGRITWTLPVPREAAFRAQVSATGLVRVRLGVSDLRTYEPHLERTIAAADGWVQLDADLSEYAGVKFSLFYHPERFAWRINVSIDALSGPATIALAAPQLAAPERSGVEYANRLAHAARPLRISR